MVKTAAFPFPKEDAGDGGEPPLPSEGLPPKSGGTKRNIPKDHPFDPRSLKPMAKALWAASVSLGHALTAYRHWSRLKSASISPDGMLGGRGYIMEVADIRQKLHSACDALSAITDTLHDEISAPHWKPRLAELNDNETEDIERFVEESEKILEHPEDEAEEKADEIEAENDGGDDLEAGATDEEVDEPETDEEVEVEEEPDEETSDESEEDAKSEPESEDDEEDKEEEDDEEEEEDDEEEEEDDGKGSKTPGGGGLSEAFAQTSDASTGLRNLKQSRRKKLANSSIPAVGEMPGGPRVEHLDREDGTPNPDDAYPLDGWGVPSETEYGYPSPWENRVDEKSAQSTVPNHVTEDTPTEAWDFGLGYGARGQGAGGYENPSGEGAGNKGVSGPASALPGAPNGSSGDDTTVMVERALNDRKARDLLPGDLDIPVARSDYYRGDRGNLVNTQSVMPGEATPGGELAPSLVNTDYTHEDRSTPYVRYDYTTHDYRDDPLHEWPSHEAGTTNV